VDTSKPLSINSLTSYGRLDVLCRCISTAFFLSNGFRKEIQLYIYFTIDKSILQIDGSTVRGINPDERAIAGILKRVFRGLPFPGIRFYSGNLEDLLTKYEPVMLDIHGEVNPKEIITNQSFLIGDHLGYPVEHENLISQLKKISLGSNEYLSSQTITILNYMLDHE
jgi:tRNA (pseudouridine54-N1)-methyltransferase